MLLQPRPWLLIPPLAVVLHLGLRLGDAALDGQRASAQAPKGLRYVAVGGGANPSSTEVSLEQNLVLATEVLDGPGAVLFAGGKDAPSVRELEPGTTDALLARLGELFDPRPGRDSRYRKPRLDAQPATVERLEATLTRALRESKAPLLLYVATHGEQGKERRDNFLPLWGGHGLSAARLAVLHDAHPRPLRVVVTGCFSGGFAELAFRAADPAQGPARAPRCGLFAGTWDRETSGCDPDPDRRNQEGYSLHFLNALAGRDRQGRALVPERLDIDGDGRVSLLEAHTRARIEADSIDVPTTTSERYLREIAPAPAQPDSSLLPEDAAVLRELGRRLGLATPQATTQRWDALDQQIGRLEARLDAQETKAGELYWPLATRLLERWPVLDDPYHPRFAPTLAKDRSAIAEALDTWPEARAYYEAAAQLAALDMQYAKLLVDEAQVQRLIRARETLELAAGLRQRGGPEYDYYRKLLACERYIP